MLGRRLLSSKRRALFILPIWIAVSFWMWLWWLGAPHGHYFEWLYFALTGAMLYEFTVLPTALLYFVLRAKRPPRRRTLNNRKVAVITLCVPSHESIEIIKRQLQAIAAITYPHDSWVLDEGNNKIVKKLALQHRVKYFSRKGTEKYNQDKPPFKAKTKAGNVNAWLDKVKRHKYDFFVQLDIDHRPKPNYLNKTLGYFRDEKVAWVQAPSVYKNLHYWTARGAAELELAFQGPLQMGFYGHSETPFIIGSHSTYRMSAVREIGGFQPTRAEDHLDTLVLASKGWRGVFLPEIIAEGDGPETLSTYLSQHFAWAFSMFQVLMNYSPKLLKTMPIKNQLQFLFTQTWYPLWSLSNMVMFVAPLIILTTNHYIVVIKGSDFPLHFLPLFCATFLIWWAARPTMQPSYLHLSWRGILLHGTTWPVILRAIVSAAVRANKPYMITPKGKLSHLKPSKGVYLSFLMLGSMSLAAIIFASFFGDYTSSLNVKFFALINIFFALSVCVVDLNLRKRDKTDTRERSQKG
jgi:cellulose synthase (UDP-forming)